MDGPGLRTGIPRLYYGTSRARARARARVVQEKDRK
jgi:hypothetical protein